MMTLYDKKISHSETNMIQSIHILNGMIVCLSWLKDGFDTYKINIIIYLSFDENSNWSLFAKIYLLEVCKSLRNSQLYRFYHIRLWMRDFYHIESFGKQIFNPGTRLPGAMPDLLT